MSSPDAGNYPSGGWPDKASQLLFDVGFSYALLREAERTLIGLSVALAELTPQEDNQRLKAHVDQLLARMENFRAKRLNDRDELYNAGYLAGAKLEAAEKADQDKLNK